MWCILSRYIHRAFHIFQIFIALTHMLQSLQKLYIHTIVKSEQIIVFFYKFFCLLKVNMEFSNQNGGRYSSVSSHMLLHISHDIFFPLIKSCCAIATHIQDPSIFFVLLHRRSKSSIIIMFPEP